MPEPKLNWKIFIRVGAAICGLAVLLGAFGAHALEGRLTELYEPDRAARKLDSWQTAVKYQLVHGLALIAVGLLYEKFPTSRLRLTAALFMFGLCVFCGCLYFWVLSDWKPLVMLVPLGGVAFILGWISLGLNPFNNVKSDSKK